MRFESPLAFLVLFIIPLVVYLYLRKRSRGSLKFSSAEHTRGVRRSFRQKLLWIPLFFRVTGLVLLAVALARPQKGTEEIKEISKGIAIEMVVDRSSSMSAEMEFAGEKLNRLEVVKKVFEEFVYGAGGGLPGRPNDLIGMVAFARYTDTLCPLTLAHGALSRFLDSLHIVRQREEDGTAIGDAIALAAARLKTAEEILSRQTGRKDKYDIKGKVIILLTDGQNNFGKRTPIQAAALAKEWGIRLYAVGVGGGEGVTTVQTPFGAYKMATGQGVDEAALKAVADETGGIYRLATNAESLRTIYREINELEKTDIETVRYVDYRELFFPFALASLLALALEVMLSSTVFRRIP